MKSGRVYIWFAGGSKEIEDVAMDDCRLGRRCGEQTGMNGLPRWF
jgi:hypothetical protein